MSTAHTASVAHALLHGSRGGTEFGQTSSSPTRVVVQVEGAEPMTRTGPVATARVPNEALRCS